jgi:hypothetical protein
MRFENPGPTGRIRRSQAAENAPVGHVYRTVWWHRAAVLLTVIVGLGIIWSGVSGIATDQDDSHVGAIVIGTILAIVGTLLTVNAWISRISFSDSAIEQSTLLDQDIVYFDAIGGRREYSRWVGRMPARFIRIESLSGRDRLEIRKWRYNFDDDFWRWFDQLPNLDSDD